MLTIHIFRKLQEGVYDTGVRCQRVVERNDIVEICFDAVVRGLMCS